MTKLAKCPLCHHMPAKTRVFVEGPTEQSVVNWNTLCEWIRLGKDAMDMAPDEEVTVGISGITTERIPALLTMEDVLRDCALEIDAHMGDHKGLLAKINTVLSQGERHDCED